MQAAAVSARCVCVLVATCVKINSMQQEFIQIRSTCRFGSEKPDGAGRVLGSEANYSHFSASRVCGIRNETELYLQNFLNS